MLNQLQLVPLIYLLCEFFFWWCFWLRSIIQSIQWKLSKIHSTGLHMFASASSDTRVLLVNKLLHLPVGYKLHRRPRDRRVSLQSCESQRKFCFFECHVTFPYVMLVAYNNLHGSSCCHDVNTSVFFIRFVTVIYCVGLCENTRIPLWTRRVRRWRVRLGMPGCSC